MATKSKSKNATKKAGGGGKAATAPAKTSTTNVSHSDAVAHAEHPSDWQYIKVAIILAVITAAEVGLFYIKGIPVVTGNVILGVMAVAKFVIVAMYFMHLKYDTRLLRRFFIGGIILAMFCYIVVLLMFGIWIG